MAFDDISIYFNYKTIISVHLNEIISGCYESHAGVCVAGGSLI